MQPSHSSSHFDWPRDHADLCGGAEEKAAVATGTIAAAGIVLSHRQGWMGIRDAFQFIPHSPPIAERACDAGSGRHCIAAD